MKHKKFRSAPAPFTVGNPYANLISFMLGLPGMRAIYGNFNNNLLPGGTLALSPQGTASNMVKWDQYGMYPYVNLLRASSQYLSYTGAFASNEGITWSTLSGLKWGGWFRIDDFGSDVEGLIGTWDAYNSKCSFTLLIDYTSLGSLRQHISNTGSYVAALDQTSTATLPLDKWFFIVGSYIPSTEMRMKAYWDGELKINDAVTSSIPSSVYYHASMTFYVGAKLNTSNVLQRINGDVGVTFYSVCYWEDELDNVLYNMGRKLYKV